MTEKLSLSSIEAFIFDFDGVLTDDLVSLNKDGIESVTCSRSDGLAFDVLRILKKPAFIVSTEKNEVVSARGTKLNIPVIQGVTNKFKAVKKLSIEKNFDLDKFFYVGNDLNDYHAMKLCGFSACPVDSHKKIKLISTFILHTKGGNGVVRELLEDIFKIDFLEVLYSNK